MSEEVAMVGRKRWGVGLAAFAAAIALSYIPMPGVDHDALPTEANAGMFGLNFNLRAPLFAVVGGALMNLLPVRGFLLILARDSVRARMIAFTVYEAMCVVSAWFLALQLESYGLYDVVRSPGTLFRLSVVVTCMASAALLWFIADVITASRVANGPLLLFSVPALFGVADSAMRAGEIVQDGAALLPTSLTAIAGPLALTIVLMGVWRYSPAAWPLRVSERIQVWSSLDLILFPVVAASVLAQIPAAVANPFTLASSFEAPLVSRDAVMALASVLTAIGVVVWLARRGEKRGSVAFLIAAPVVLLTGVGVTLLSLTLTGALLMAPGPFAGDQNVDIELLAGSNANVANDIEVICARLDALGIEFEAHPEADRVRLRMREIRDAEAIVQQLLDMRSFSMRLVALDQGPLAPMPGELPPPGLELDHGYTPERVAMWTGPTRESLAALIARVDPAHRGDVAIECQTQDEGNEKCAAYLLEPPVITHGDVEEAHIALDPQTNKPYVAITLRDPAARRFGEVTAASVRRKLAIVIGDTIQSAPVIMSAIHGGQVQVTMGGMRSYEEVLRDARDIQLVVQSGGLSAPWTQGSIRAF